MEAYTSMHMTVKGRVNVNEVVVLLKNELMKKANDRFSKKYVPVFCNDIKVYGKEVDVDESCSLSSSEMEYFKDVLTTIAESFNCEFTFSANHYSCNCGYEEYIEASYKNGVLTYKDMASEDMVGCCSDEECDEYIVHATEYDPSKTYTCPECGRVVSEEELFPNGVPTWEVEEIRIK